MDKHVVHLARDSLFSTSSGWTNYRGFFNLAFILLVISNGRVALENVIKYGILISPLQWVESFNSSPWSWPNLSILLGSNISIMAAFILERLLAKGWLNNNFAAVAYVFIISTLLAVPPAIILRTEDTIPLFSFWALTSIVIVALKLVSYGHVNYWLRAERDSMRKGKQKDQNNKKAEDQNEEEEENVEEEKDEQQNEKKKSLKSPSVGAALNPAAQLCYPFNLTAGNLYYFMVAPTLCYELRFPRTPARRKRFIFKRIIELICFSFVIMALIQQWVMPLVKNSLAPFSEMDVTRCVERVFKLAIPNHLIWLMWFYLYFHSFLNLIAELLRFADREFYMDFWNAESVAVFWKTWNIPAHQWAVRHVYKPFVRNGYGKLTASLAVFIVSAFFHEYLVSVPLKMFRLWACTGMLAQFPLGMFTEQLKGGRAGNIIVWLSLILGQPIAVLMYVHDWYLLNHPELHMAQNLNSTEHQLHI